MDHTFEGLTFSVLKHSFCYIPSCVIFQITAIASQKIAIKTTLLFFFSFFFQVCVAVDYFLGTNQIYLFLGKKISIMSSYQLSPSPHPLSAHLNSQVLLPSRQ